MEMEFKDPARKRRFLLVMVGAVLAAAAGLSAFTLASHGTQQVEVPKKMVLVAARDIPARTTVSEDDVTTRDVPVAEALDQSYQASADVVGRVTSVPIYTDQQVTPNLFATATADADFSILGPGDTVTADSPPWRAVALEVPANRAVGGEIKSGDHVDVIVSVEIDVLVQNDLGEYVKTDTASAQGFQTGESTKLTFQDLEVLKSTPDDDMYVIKVDLHQAEQIAHIQQLAPGSFSLALRPGEDTRTADTSQFGTTTDRLIMTYLYPAPQLIDLSKLLGPPLTPVPGGSPIPGGTPTGSPTPSGSPSADQSPAPDASPAASATP